MSVYHPPGWDQWAGAIFASGFVVAGGLGAYLVPLLFWRQVFGHGVALAGTRGAPAPPSSQGLAASSGSPQLRLSLASSTPSRLSDAGRKPTPGAALTWRSASATSAATRRLDDHGNRALPRELIMRGELMHLHLLAHKHLTSQVAAALLATLVVPASAAPSQASGNISPAVQTGAGTQTSEGGPVTIAVT